MKAKKYIIPTVRQLHLSVEQLLAASGEGYVSGTNLPGTTAGPGFGGEGGDDDAPTAKQNFLMWH